MMTNSEVTAARGHTEDVATEPEKAARLRAFRGPVEARDAEVVEHWRTASPEAHAAAMLELAHYAEQITAYTGLGKAPEEMFPGFPRTPRASGRDGSSGP